MKRFLEVLKIKDDFEDGIKEAKCYREIGSYGWRHKITKGRFTEQC